MRHQVVVLKQRGPPGAILKTANQKPASSSVRTGVPGTLYLDAHRLVVQVDDGADRTGPGVEVEEGGGCQSEEGDDGRSRERGEQELEKEVHGAGTRDRVSYNKRSACLNQPGPQPLNSAPDVAFRRPKSTRLRNSYRSRRSSTPTSVQPKKAATLHHHTHILGHFKSYTISASL